MAMKCKGRHNSFWEADCYLQKAQDIISRSLRELASITIKNDNKQTRFLRQYRQSLSNLHSSATVYRKNSFPALCVSEYDIVNFLQSFSSSDDQSADAEYYSSSRRRRFTRRQRRNLADEIFRERTSKSTSVLNKVHRSESTSSSDNVNINERRKRSTQLTRTKKKGESTVIKSREAASLSLRQNYANSSLITRSTAEICCKSTLTQVPAPIKPAEIFRKFKGPAARKAHHRALQCKLNSFANNDEFETNAELQTRLNNHDDNTQFKKNTLVQRSVSVRDLNGTMIDFTNQDSVTRWTSQILAEINSLPSSSFDLSGQSILQSSSFITSAATTIITDRDIVHTGEPECNHLKNIQHQSIEIPEVSRTAHIVLTARPSSRRKQSVHAVVISVPTTKEISQKLHFLSPKLSNTNRGPNMQSNGSVKNGSSSNESSRFWHFLARKKYLSLKKYLKLRQKSASIMKIVSGTEILGSSKENSSVVTNDKNHPRTNLSLILDIKPDRHSPRMPKMAYGQLSGYTTTNDVEWRNNIDNINESNEHIASRAHFSMESIDLAKKSDIDGKLKFLRETKRIQPVAETSLSFTICKRRNEANKMPSWKAPYAMT